METIITIAGFILFSVLMDAFESRRKKKRDAPLPEPEAQMPPERGGKKRARRQRQPSLEIPPPPQAQSRPQTPQTPRSAATPVVQSAPAGIAAEQHFVDPAQLYSNALLDAVAYAEILQPPKAYQYMATRSCMGHWPEKRR